MQEKKNKRLALLLIVLLSAILIFIFLRNDGGTYAVQQDLYSDIDLKSVDRVVIESPAGKTDLRFQGYRWKVNDSIDADRGLVEVLFATLQQARPKRPVAEGLRDSTTQVMKKNGAKVTLYAGQNALKSFWAGGNDAKTQALFLATDGAEPHLMVIPGYRVYVSGIFELAPEAWREKLIFNFNWQNFSKLEARYKNPAGNFDVVMEDNEVSIPQIHSTDTAKLNSYLDQVSLLTVEEYIRGNAATDSLSATEPILRLNTFDIANRQYQLMVFTSGNDFYAQINGNWATLDESRIIPLLRPKEFFIKR